MAGQRHGIREGESKEANQTLHMLVGSRFVQFAECKSSDKKSNRIEEHIHGQELSHIHYAHF